MEYWICTTCGVQYAQSNNQPEGCKICLDERQYVGRKGQQWTTLAQLQQTHHNVFKEEEPGLIGIGTEPHFAIGQRALLTKTQNGNILWDCITLLDESTADKVEQLGGISAIALSHPHYYSSIVEWAERFNAPIYIHEDDQQWVTRPSKYIQFWSGDTLQLATEATIIRLGGHFSGSCVLHWSSGAAGKGALLTGDTIYVVQDRHWASFMYSYPNMLPLPAALVQHIKEVITSYPFDRLYAAWFEAIIPTDAHDAVLRSADRYIAALAGTLPELQKQIKKL